MGKITIAYSSKDGQLCASGIQLEGTSSRIVTPDEISIMAGNRADAIEALTVLENAVRATRASLATGGPE